MLPWTAPDVPRLPGQGPSPWIRDTATGQLAEAAPGPAPRMYVCGITPYDATHLGHAATYLAFDLLGRAWRDAGRSVTYVQNITDVDDPLLERATATGQDWQDLAAREIQLFREDMTALRILPPEHYIGAVESIPLVVEAIGKLAAAGAVYDVDGDLYFEVHADPTFGAVSGMTEQVMLPMFAERGGDPDRAGKRDPMDCLLWQAERPGEPAWESMLGRGRPGWHIECTAIALQYLGENFDVQGGGRDLVFPHHEMGASEAHVATGTHPYAQNYVHAGLVGLDGEKMSKSRGNLVFVSQLRRDGVDPMAIRLALLAHHYGSDWEWTPVDLESAIARLTRWRDAVACPLGPDAAPILAAVRAAMADDLAAPRALDVVDAWVEETLRGRGDDPAAPALVRDLVDALLGVSL